MKNFLYLLGSLYFFFGSQTLSAQSNFYDTDHIPEIRIYFEQSNWDHLLDSLYVAGDKDRLLANMVIDGEMLDSVGIRYKGFSSVSTSRKKNPFNIKLDYVKGNQDYAGVDKIKLSNVIQDPSFLREVLAYEVGRKYMPASRANYANVYINDVLWGLYTNVESVEKEFLSQHFGTTKNAFFKCNPDNLDFDGENSNLGNSHGTDTTDYYPFYDIESDDGWTDLYELIDILNEEPDNIEAVLNVDRTLWMHAFNYALINFDSYIGYAQNYYLYKDDNGQFNPILWDLNQSFASYRLADASEYFDGFSIAQAKTIDPLSHYSSVSVYPRPLLRNLFNNPTYRKMYIAHLRTIIEENFANQSYATRAQALQNAIESSVLADPNKFYSNDDFYNNLNSTVSDLVDYPGITDLMDARTSYLQAYAGYQGAPSVSNVDYSPTTVSVGDQVWITAAVANADEVTLAYRYGSGGLFQKVAMKDDGTQNDGAANDGVYGIQLSNIGNSVEYYLYAENATTGQFSPARAAYEFYTIQTSFTIDGIVINEFMASNTATQADEAGEFDDWIELYNNGNAEVNLAGLYLSDDLDNLKKWALPNVMIGAKGYLVVWADEDGSQGDLHANFKLSSGGEDLVLSDENGDVIDSVNFGAQTEDISMSRIPNGSGPFEASPPTFNASNSPTSTIEQLTDITFSLSPNPAHQAFYLNFEEQIPSQLQLYAVDGKLLMTQAIAFEKTVEVEVGDLLSGLYYVSLVFEDFVLNRKIIVQH